MATEPLIHWNPQQREAKYWLSQLRTLQADRLALLAVGGDTTAVDADIATAETGLSDAGSIAQTVVGFGGAHETDFDADPDADYGIFYVSGGTIRVGGVDYEVTRPFYVFASQPELAAVVAEIDLQVPEALRDSYAKFADDIPV